MSRVGVDIITVASHYSQNDSMRKTSFVRDSLVFSKARDVLDIGANTGVFSRLAASVGARVVALDRDVAATEQAWRTALDGNADVVSLVADIARPTPATGWNNAETLSLLDRCRGRFDLVMMLAVIHHLLASDQIPLARLAELTRELTRRWVLVEWVPPSDPKFRELSRGRDLLHRHLDKGRFLSAFGTYFSHVKDAELENGRTLHLLEVR